MTVTELIIVAGLFLMLVANFSFYSELTAVYPLPENFLFCLSVTVVFLSLTLLLLSVFSFRKVIKQFLIVTFLYAAGTAYFMDSYHVIIDDLMIQNVVQTNVAEASDLFSIRLLSYLLFIGILPGWLIWKTPLTEQQWRKAIISRARLVAIALLLIVVNLFLFSDAYASFFRNHKSIRFYTNPGYPIYSIGLFIKDSIPWHQQPWQQRGRDAVNSDPEKRQLLLLIVGETVRADHLSLNGYSRQTTPLLEKTNIINFANAESCGTSTAVSVPCMFALDGEADYNKQTFLNSDNILDLVKHSGANVLWLDNNSSSKGAADRVEFVDYRYPENNPLCDDECRDPGMLANLNNYLNQHPSGDVLIVLHQMGNHGPAYYKRYPKAFERFNPVCQTNQLEQCDRQSIINAYDNTLLYTDYFLAESINWLSSHSSQFETALFYLSDHGESLGENGLYLHGMPRLLAPKSQIHVPVMLWLDVNFDQQRRTRIESRQNENINHDVMVHTIMGLLNINSEEYQSELDISR